jgi:hypothetical protein
MAHKATVTKTTYGLLLEQNGQSIQLRIEQPVSMQDVLIDTEDVSQPKNIQDSPNPGLSRIVIKIDTRANTTGKLLLKVYPGTLNK